MKQKGYDFELHINDYGVEVKPHEIERILKPFFQFVEVKDCSEFKPPRKEKK